MLSENPSVGDTHNIEYSLKQYGYLTNASSRHSWSKTPAVVVRVPKHGADVALHKFPLLEEDDLLREGGEGKPQDGNDRADGRQIPPDICKEQDRPPDAATSPIEPLEVGKPFRSVLEIEPLELRDERANSMHQRCRICGCEDGDGCAKRNARVPI